MCVLQVVTDQGNPLRLRKVYVHQVLQDLGEIQFGAARKSLPRAASPQSGAVIMNRSAVPTQPVLIVLAGGADLAVPAQPRALPDARPGRLRPHTPPDVGGPEGAG